MNEINEEVIAQLASQLYNQSPTPSAEPGGLARHNADEASHQLPGAVPFGVPADHRLTGHDGSWRESPVTEAPGNAPSLPTARSAPNAGQGLADFVRRMQQPTFLHPSGNADLAERLRGIARLDSVHSPGLRPGTFDPAAVRADFPILRQRVNGHPLVWLDNAATTQKPQCVIDALKHFYEIYYSNIHRAAHTLAARATEAYERARSSVQRFLGAADSSEIVFVRGTTEGINLIAQTYGRKFIQPGDEIVLSILEHHASIVPWQLLAKERGAVLRVIPVNDRGEILLDEYRRLLSPRTRLVALAHANNSLGTILPVEEMTALAKAYGARVLIDGAQSVAHLGVNVQTLGADFFVFSGHKIFGPTGIGAVYIRRELHEILPPWQAGGNMIRNVTFEETTFAEAPAKFEAGTPNVADAVGLGVALDYVSRLGLPQIAAYEHGLLEYATAGLCRIPGLRLIGTARQKVGVLSFVLPQLPTEQVGQQLSRDGIAVRAGHHCAQPSLRRFGLESTVRPSLAMYNTREDVDRLVDSVRRIARSGA